MSSLVSAVSLSHALTLLLSPQSPPKHAPPTHPQSPPPALYPHSCHHPLSRSPRYRPNSLIGSPALHSNPDKAAEVRYSICLSAILRSSQASAAMKLAQRPPACAS